MTQLPILIRKQINYLSKSIMNHMIYKLILFLSIIFTSCNKTDNLQNQYISTDRRIQPFIKFSTDTLSFMDEVSSYIDLTDTEYLKEYITDNHHYYFEAYELIENTNYFNDISLSKVIRFSNDGRYYIIVNLYDHNISDLFGFQYKEHFYVTNQILVGLFNDIEYNSLNMMFFKMAEENEIDEDIDDTGEFTDWRFVVEKGKIKTAVCLNHYRWYDLHLNREISEDEFFINLPLPLKAISNPDYNPRFYNMH